MSRHLCRWAFALGALTSAWVSVAAGPTLEDLLKQVQESAQQTSEANRAREARFNQQKAQQAALVAQAKAELAAVEAQVSGVKARYQDNQQAIADLKAQLASRSGDYAQAFAAIRQSAQDLGPQLLESPVHAQLPARAKLLETLAKSPAQPGINQIEQYWATLFAELTEQGQIRRYTATVRHSDGQSGQDSVTRVGVFATLDDAGYFAAPAPDGSLRHLARQPEGGALRQAREWLSGDAIAPLLVDPTRGGILALAVERPTFGERIEMGGWPGYVIIAVGAAGLAAALFQWGYLVLVWRRVQRQLRNANIPSPKNPLGRVLGVFAGDTQAHDPEVLELRLSEAVLRETPAIERFQSFLRLVIAAGPLLGLLGTVAGMIETFQVLMETGTSDPKLMASGISKAMIATVLGLGVAIPLLFINAYLQSRSRALVQILDEQSAGLLAQKLEDQLAATAALRTGPGSAA